MNISDFKLLIVPGVPKCGTSSMFEDLIQLPNVVVNHQKELNTPLNDDQFINRWCDAFNPTKQASGWIVDATQDYSWKINQGDLEYLSTKPFKDIRVMLMFRNPVYRLLSNYTMNCKQMNTKIDFATYRVSEAQKILSDYPAILNRCVDIFGQDAVKMVISEDYFNPDMRGGVLDGIVEFLGLPDIDTSTITNKIISPYSKSGPINHNIDKYSYELLSSGFTGMIQEFEQRIGKSTGWCHE